MTEPMAPPPPPFPPAPAPQQNNTMKWVLGCGLGCLVVVIIVVAAVAGLAYWGVTHGAPMAVQQAYTQFKTEGKVPAEDQPTYDRIVELGTGSNASMYASGLVASIVFSTLADGVVSEDDRAALSDAVAMLEADPNISAAQLQEFQRKHPGISGGPGAFGMPPPAPAPEPPMEPEVAVPPTPESPAAPPAVENAPEAPPAEGAAPTQ